MKEMSLRNILLKKEFATKQVLSTPLLRMALQKGEIGQSWMAPVAYF